MSNSTGVASFLELEEQRNEVIYNFENLDGFRVLSIKSLIFLFCLGTIMGFAGILLVNSYLYSMGTVAVSLVILVMLVSTIWIYPMSRIDWAYAYQKMRKAAVHYNNENYLKALEKLQDLKKNSIWTYISGDDVVLGYSKYVSALEDSSNLEEDMEETFEDLLEMFGARYRHKDGYGGYLATELGYDPENRGSRIQAALLPFKMLFKNQLAAELVLHIIALGLGILVYVLLDEAIAAIFSSIVLSAVIRIAKAYFSEE